MKRLFLTKNIVVDVPENKKENNSPTFSVNSEFEEIFKYYQDNGYVIIKDILKGKEANTLVKGWEREVKKYKGYLIRQSSSIPEKNIFNEKNWVMNSLQHIQNLPKKEFPELTSSFFNLICENKKLADLIRFFIQGKPRLVQSMFFEGNTKTAAHYDSFYLDDEIIGRMAACWIALEDIDWNAGRFFICPKSHLETRFQNSQHNVQEHNFIESIYKLIKNKNYEVRAPFLQKGEILIWNSLTIHGALQDFNPENSRKSITVHFTRTNTKFRSFRNQLQDLKVEEKNYIDIHKLFSYNYFFKLNMLAEVKFPKLKKTFKSFYKFFRNLIE